MKHSFRALCAGLLCAVCLCALAVPSLATDVAPLPDVTPSPDAVSVTSAATMIPLATPSGNGLEVKTEVRPFVYEHAVLRYREVRFYDNVYCLNHTEYVQTPFDASVPSEFFIVDDRGYLALSASVLDITDAMRIKLYGADVGTVAMYYGQYCEDARSNTIRITTDSKGVEHRRVVRKFAPSGIHEGVDFFAAPKQPIHALLDGVVLKAGGGRDNPIAIYNEALNVTVLYLHTKGVEVKKGDTVSAGQLISHESYLGIDFQAVKHPRTNYTHVEVRTGKFTGASPYRNITLTSDCPYALFRQQLNVVPSGREPITAASMQAAEEQRQADQAAVAAKRRAEEEAERQRLAEEAERNATPTPSPTPVPTPEPTVEPAMPDNFGFAETPQPLPN